MFCPKCGSILVVDSEKKKLKCVCGYVPRVKKNIILKEKVLLKKGIEVMDERELKALPKIKEDCKKCGNKYAYYWLIQTRSADEAETKFLECTKCGHRWRLYE